MAPNEPLRNRALKWLQALQLTTEHRHTGTAAVTAAAAATWQWHDACRSMSCKIQDALCSCALQQQATVTVTALETMWICERA